MRGIFLPSWMQWYCLQLTWRMTFRREEPWNISKRTKELYWSFDMNTKFEHHAMLCIMDPRGTMTSDECLPLSPRFMVHWRWNTGAGVAGAPPPPLLKFGGALPPKTKELWHNLGCTRINLQSISTQLAYTCTICKNAQAFKESTKYTWCLAYC